METFPKNLLESESITTDHQLMEFIAAGIACNALTVLYDSGILDDIKNKGFIEEEEIKDNSIFQNPILIKSALKSLCASKVLIKSKSLIIPTEFGKKLFNHIGLINLLFESYSRLIAEQVKISNSQSHYSHDLIDWKSMSHASSLIAGEDIDDILRRVIEEAKIKGTLCDIGCGSGRRLANICSLTSLSGLGIDQSVESVSEARANVKNKKIEFVIDNAKKLKKTWESVEFVMQCFMTHDLFPPAQCAQILKSYKKNFPNMKFFAVVDVVTRNYSAKNFTPGFDYVHGLQGIETLCKEEVSKIFKNSGYTILRELPIPALSSSYLWILKPVEKT